MAVLSLPVAWLFLDVLPKPHVVTGGVFSEVVASRVCGAEINLWCRVRVRVLGLRM